MPVSLSRPQESPAPARDQLAAERWDALERRDARADGAFVFGVRTTGIYCRPSCPARRPRPENIVFFPTGEAAERAGFRACKRCRPNDMGQAERDAALVAHACRSIEAAEDAPSLSKLAESAKMSPFHFHRVFKKVTGVTPKAYAGARRAERVAATLRRGEASVTNAIYDAGYGSSSRFYTVSNERLGMTPTAYREGGAKAAIRYAVSPCSLGSVLVAATGKGVSAILLGDDPEALVRALRERFPKAALTGGDRDFEAIVAQVVGLVEEPWKAADLPLDIAGTAFQQRVWKALRSIPAGKTASYAEIAKAIGSPKSVRAVAQACATNPVAVAIPCHRVVRSDGALSGYRWGAARKRALLARERDGAA